MKHIHRPALAPLLAATAASPSPAAQLPSVGALGVFGIALQGGLA